MSDKTVLSILNRHLVPGEDYVFGFADLSGLTGERFMDYPYGISIGRRLDDRIVDSIRQGPNQSYYDHYRETNDTLSRLAGQIAGDLEQTGMNVVTVEPTVSTAALDTEYASGLRTDLSHKMVATRAGLGWIGKTALFISFRFGPRLRLVTILTDTPLRNEREPVTRSRCGTCILCVEACPARAATGQLWDITMDRDVFFNARKCRAMCHEFGKSRLHADARICGICISVCPVGQ
jgi:epoxyqueuosine reductase